MHEALRYSILIAWSDEDLAYVVSFPEWGPLLHTHGATYEEALHNAKELLAALVTLAHERGEALPVPRAFAHA